MIRIITYNSSSDEVNVKYSLEKQCSKAKTKATQTIREWLDKECGEIYLRETAKWEEFKVRLAASDYPREEKAFHRKFYDLAYGLEKFEDEIEVQADSPEAKFENRLKLLKSIDWSRVTEDTKNG